MSMTNISVIIITYNSSKEIRRCIDSVLKNRDAKTNIRITIIDNNSTDDTKLILKKYVKNNKIFDITFNKNNVGFSKAVNQAIKKNDSDYFLLLNPDVFLEKNSLKNIIKCATLDGVGICGGKTVGLHGEKQGDHFRIPNLMVGIFDFTNLRKFLKSDYWHNYFYDNYSNPSKLKLVGSVSGGYMLINKDTIKKIGYLDEDYFMYLEDVDFCLRANNNGVKVVYCPSAKGVHIGGASSNNKERSNMGAWNQSRKIFYIKNFGLLQNIIIQPIFFFDEVLIKIKRFIDENLSH